MTRPSVRPARRQGACAAERFVVTGASGAGKTTVLPYLIDALPECAVFDVDDLLDALGTDDWPRFRNAWLSVAHGIAQGGRSTVLCGPFIPEHLEALPARPWISDIHFAVLDCPDDMLRARLSDRPAWRGSRHAVEEHVGFGRRLRANVDHRVSTAGRLPEHVAGDLARSVRSILASSAFP